MTERKGGDGKINLDELEKLDKKLGGVKPDKSKLKKLLELPPQPQRKESKPGTDRRPKGK